MSKHKGNYKAYTHSANKSFINISAVHCFTCLFTRIIILSFLLLAQNFLFTLCFSWKYWICRIVQRLHALLAARKKTQWFDPFWLKKTLHHYRSEPFWTHENLTITLFYSADMIFFRLSDGFLIRSQRKIWITSVKCIIAYDIMGETRRNKFTTNIE